jgi:ribosomal protein L37AE/L43A
MPGQFGTRRDGRVYPKRGGLSEKVDTASKHVDPRCVRCGEPTDNRVEGIHVCEKCWEEI